MPETDLESAPPPDSRARRARRKGLALRTAGALALVAGAAWGVKTLRFLAHHVVTDDAQVEAHVAPVLPKVTGYVTEVLVADNEKVAAGQPLQVGAELHRQRLVQPHVAPHLLLPQVHVRTRRRQRLRVARVGM